MKFMIPLLMTLSIAATASASEQSWHWIRMNSHSSQIAQAYQCNYQEQSQLGQAKSGVAQLYVDGSVDSSYITIEIHYTGETGGVETGMNIQDSTHMMLLNGNFAGLAQQTNSTKADTQLKFVKYSTGMDMIESSYGKILRRYTNCAPVPFKN